jgi:hypothetical protein
MLTMINKVLNYQMALLTAINNTHMECRWALRLELWPLTLPIAFNDAGD